MARLLHLFRAFKANEHGVHGKSLMMSWDDPSLCHQQEPAGVFDVLVFPAVEDDVKGCVKKVHVVLLVDKNREPGCKRFQDLDLSLCGCHGHDVKGQHMADVYEAYDAYGIHPQA